MKKYTIATVLGLSLVISFGALSQSGSLRGMFTSLEGISKQIASLLTNQNTRNLAQVSGGVASLPELPRVYIDTTFPSQNGKTTTVQVTNDPVANGKAFQAALDGASPGDTIVLPSGYIYEGNFKLKKNNPPGTWIVIRTDKLTQLPPQGRRVFPSDGSLMPILRTPSVSPALEVLPGSSGYWITGVAFTENSNYSNPLPSGYGSPSMVGTPIRLVYVLVQVGGFGSAQNTMAQVPQNITFDRVYAYSDNTAHVKRCFGFDGAYVSIVDSYISGCKAIGQDSQAIAGYNGPGPFKIVNNFVEGAAENVMFGGADPSIPNLVPSDIEIRRNHIYKPLTWNRNDPAYAGVRWAVKNLWETKNNQRVLFEGNVLENNWADAQVGFGIVLKSSNDGGRCSWCVTQDVTIRNNIMRNSAQGINITRGDDYSNGGVVPLNKVKIENNLFENVGTGRFIQLLNNLRDLVIDHNTITGSPKGNADVQLDAAIPMDRISITNNIFPDSNYSVIGNGSGMGTASLNKHATSWQFAGNILPMFASYASTHPTGNFFPVNFASMGLDSSYRLPTQSPYKNAGTDGKDPGADIDSVLAATSGAVSGVWSGGYTPPVTPPVTTPAPTLSFSASPISVTGTEQTVLSWSTTNATSCSASGGWSGNKGTSGTESMTLANNTTFTLTCNGVSGATSKNVSVTYAQVTPAPTTKAPTITMSASKTSISKGDSTVLTWSTTDATACTTSGGWNETIPVNGRETLRPIVTTSYAINCTGTGGSATQNITISVLGDVPSQPIPSITLSAEPSTITVGNSSTLNWSSANATSCSASNGWGGSLQTAGNKSVSPINSTTYTITCTGVGGTARQNVTVSVKEAEIVEVPVVSKPTLSFFASPQTILSGRTATLTWASANATYCSASGGWAGTRTTSGSTVVDPRSSTSYYLTCVGPGGSIAESTQVSVSNISPDPATDNEEGVQVPVDNIGSISIGDQITVTHAISVRTSASTRAARLGIEKKGARGSIIAGPINSDGYVWWNVRYESGLSGWSVSNYFSKISGSASTQVITQPAVISEIRFAVGDWVKVTDGVNVRGAPGITGNRLGFQRVGSVGKIVGGPVESSGYRWWNIDFLSGADGWSAAEFFTSTTKPQETSSVPVSQNVSAENDTLPPPNFFTLGDRVRTTATINVRRNPGLDGTVVGQQGGGVSGTVAQGPILSGGYTWWRLEFDSGPGGWVASNYVKKQ
jgi:hypothetical protein